MKRATLLAMTIICLMNVSAQEEPKTKEKVVDDKSKDRIVLDFTFDNWLHQLPASSGFSTDWFSRGFNLYMMYDVQLGSSPMSLAIGAGLGTSSMFLNSAIVKADSGKVSTFAPITQDYKKNKLSLNYVEVPIELRYRSKSSPNGNSFKVALGFKGGYLFNSHTKYKIEENGKSKTFKESRIDNLYKFRFGPTFRIGYGPVNFIAWYGASKVFDNGKGPDLRPFSVGISINGL